MNRDEQSMYSLCCGYTLTYAKNSILQNICGNCKKVVTATRGYFDTQETILLKDIKNKLQEILEAINTK